MAVNWHRLAVSFIKIPRHYPKLFSITCLIVLLKVLDSAFPIQLPGNAELYARVVVDQRGRPLRVFPDSKGVWRYHVTLDQVSPLYLDALLTYEDRRFWYHPGIDPLALVRAAALNVRYGRIVSGGSTISMQVARLLHPHSRTLRGKAYQMLRTLQLEWHLSKHDILQLYCNVAPFGGTIEGVQAASYTYLDKPAMALSHAEAALLAVLPQSPTRYRPDLNPLIAQHARDKVLERMVSLGRWSKQTVDDAKIENVYAMRKVPEQHAALLAQRLVQEPAETSASQGVIATTIDGDLQSTLESYVRQYTAQQPGGTSAAILVVENQTAEVKAYLGAADFGNQTRFGHVDMVQAIRSPGSTLKPFLYALALDDGLIHSHSLLADTPQTWQQYRPANFSDAFSGPVTATEALQRSLNVPAVALMDRYGPHSFVGRLHNVGLGLTIPGGSPNLSVILGGAGITLEQLVEGYMAFGREGKNKPLRYTPNQAVQPERYFFSPQAAWVVQNMLRDAPRANSIRRTSAIATEPGMAWKTGTSYGFRDVWAIGVNRRYTVGVWLGRPDGTPVPGTSGRGTAGPLLHTISDYLGSKDNVIVKPKGIDRQQICWPLGTAKDAQKKAYCHRRFEAWIINETVPPTWPDRAAPLSPNPFTFWLDGDSRSRVEGDCASISPRQQTVALWPTTVEPWISPHWRRMQQVPQLKSGCVATDVAPRLKIEDIASNTRLRAASGNDSRPRLTLEASGGEGKRHWYIDGHFLRAAAPGLKISHEFDRTGTVQIVVVDDGGNTDKIEVTVQ